MLFERLEVAASLEAVAELRAALVASRERLNIRRELIDDLALALSEIAANAVRHGRPRAQNFIMELHVEGAALRLDFTDDGGPFPDFARRWADSGMAPLDPMAESGRGLWLVRNSVDRFGYEHVQTDSGNSNRWSFWRDVVESDRPAVLLVEDDETTRGLFVSVLSKVGRVTCAASLAEAAGMLSTTPFELVVADYNLGDGSMADLLGGFRQADSEPDMPFIFVTADRSGAARAHALKHGIHSVLQKPVRPRELQDRANEAMAAHRAHMERAARRLARNVGPLIACTTVTEAAGFRLVARGATASAGGGDLFMDVCPDAGRRRFVLADCAGHGMTARIQASALTGVMSGLASSGLGDDRGGPEHFIDAVSRTIHAGRGLEGLVATLITMDLNPDGRIVLATGGHPAPFLLGPGGRTSPVPLNGAMPGLMPVTGSIPRQLALGEGERLFLATDGLAPDSSHALDGLAPAVRQALAATADMPLAVAADHLSAVVTSTVGVYPADDWTFVLVERAGAQPAAV